MATYENCYKIASDVRRGVNEFSTALLQGTDTSGAHSNDEVIRAINDAQKFLYHLLVKRIQSEFEVHDQDLVVTNSIASLPGDFGRLIQIKNEYGRLIYPIRIREKVPTNSTGNKRFYLRKKGLSNQIQIERTGVNATYKISYIMKPRNIHYGQAGSGSTTQSIVLDSNHAPKVIDYYNQINIENITQDWVDTISDYTAGRVATISTEEAAEDDFYGLVPEFPETFHHLIAPQAIILLKDTSPVSQEKSTTKENDNLTQLLIAALRAFQGNQDVDYEDMFTDFEPLFPTTGIVPIG